MSIVRGVSLSAMAVLLFGWGISTARGHLSVMALPHRAAGWLPPPYRTATERKAWLQRNRRLSSLWLQRDRRSVSQEIAHYLEDPNLRMRLRAVRALGRLEDPWAVPSIERLRSENARARSRDPDLEVATRIAVARIESRQLSASQRVDALCDSVGLSRDGLIALSRVVNDPKEGHQAQGSPADLLVEEAVDLLYSMAKRGQDIQELRDQLLLTPALRIKLSGATLSSQDEAKQILDYVVKLDIVSPDDAALAETHLVGLGSSATTEIVHCLQRRLSDRTKFGKNGCVPLFRAAADTGDARVLPLLKQYENETARSLPRGYRGSPVRVRQLREYNDYWIHAFAEQTRQRLEQNLMMPQLP